MGNRRMQSQTGSRAAQPGVSVGSLSSRSLSQPALLDGCTRCGGLLVRDYCVDVLQGAGDVQALRCIQCGDVLDAVILANRYAQPVALSGSSPLALRGITLGRTGV